MNDSTMMMGGGVCVLNTEHRNNPTQTPKKDFSLKFWMVH